MNTHSKNHKSISEAEENNNAVRHIQIGLAHTEKSKIDIENTVRTINFVPPEADLPPFINQKTLDRIKKAVYLFDSLESITINVNGVENTWPFLNCDDELFQLRCETAFLDYLWRKNYIDQKDQERSEINWSDLN